MRPCTRSARRRSGCAMRRSPARRCSASGASGWRSAPRRSRMRSAPTRTPWRPGRGWRDWPREPTATQPSRSAPDDSTRARSSAPTPPSVATTRPCDSSHARTSTVGSVRRADEPTEAAVPDQTVAPRPHPRRHRTSCGDDVGPPPPAVPVSSTSQEAVGAGTSVSALLCGQLARIGWWMGHVTLSSRMGMPCTSNARPHSLHRPGGAVWWLHASEFRVHSVHSLMSARPS